MGRGMAIAFAYAGHPVRLVDVKERDPASFEALSQAVEAEVASTLTMMGSFGMLDNGDVTEILSRVTCHPLSGAAEALKKVPVIFEGVPETLPEFVGFVGLSGVFLFNFRPWLPGGQSSASNGN